MAREMWLLADHGELAEGKILTLDSTESHHAAGPLRLTAEDRVVLTDGCGIVADAALRRVASGGCRAEILSVQTVPQPPEMAVAVAVGVLHGRAMDWAIQKSVEVGVGTLIPVCTERSQLKLRTARARLGHWRRLARQALKQCQRPWGLQVADPTGLEEMIGHRGGSAGLVADRDGCRVDELPAVDPPLLLVGPEGGFTAAEWSALDTAGWLRVRLGRHVLRTETAVTVGAALLVSRLSE
jgi:16S rRNA (uracil1498-N3)-methyltransferase